MKIKYTTVFSSFLSIIVFFLSLLIFPYYTGGDQYHYNLFYNTLHNYDFFQGYFYHYKNSLGASEPIYYLIIRFFSDIGANKIIVISLINSFLMYYLSNYLQLLKLNRLFIFSLLFNFYLLVLFFTAERLKISFLFFILAISFSGYKQIFFIAISIFSHMQMIILFSLSFILKNFSIVFFKKKKKFLFLVMGILCFIVFLMKDYLIMKVSIYYAHNAGDISGVIKILSFYMISLFYAKKIKVSLFKISFAFLLLIILCLIVGGDRIVIFSYFICFYYLTKYKNGNNFAMYALSIYFSCKGILFILNILLDGNGFIGV